MRTECPVLSLAASPTLWDQHSNRGRVGRWPRDRGRGWRRDPVLSSGGGVCNPCPSPGMVLGAAGASPVLPRGWSWGRCQHPLVLPWGWSWGRCWHPLVLSWGWSWGGVNIPWSSPGDGPGGGAGIPWSSPGDGPGGGAGIPSPWGQSWGQRHPLSSPGAVLGEALASSVPPRGWSWGRCRHPLVLSWGDGPGGGISIPWSSPRGGPGGGVGIPWSSPGGMVLGEALTSPGPPPGVVSASPGAGTHRKRRRKPACRPRAPARDRAALRGAISSSPPPLKPKLACGDVVWLRPG